MFIGRDNAMDSVWSWLTCLACSMSVALALGFSYSYGVLLPVFIKYFHTSTGTTAWLGSLTMSFAFLFGPLSGAVSHRFGCRATIIVGGFLCAVGLLSSSATNSFPLLFFTYSVVYGIGSSFIFTSSIVSVPLNFDKHCALATGIISAGQGVGILGFGPLLQALLDRFSWNMTFKISSGILFCVCLLGICVRSSKQTNVQQDEPVTRSRCEHRTIQIPSQDSVPFWRNLFYIIMTLGSSVEFFGQYTPHVHIVKHCGDIGISRQNASSLYIFFGITTSVTRVAAGLLCKIKIFHPRILCQLAGYGVAISMFALPFAKTLTTLRTCFFFYGLFDGVFVTTSNFARLNCLSPMQRAVGFGLSAGCTAIFGAIGPPLAGMMADALSSYRPVFFMAGSVVCLGATIPFMLKCTPSSRGLSHPRLVDSYSSNDDFVIVEYLTVL